MKTWIKVVILAFVTISGSIFFAAKGFTTDLHVNGLHVKLETKIDNENGVTYLPITEFTKSLGVKSEWDNKSKVATLYQGKNVVKIDVNKKTVSKGNSVKKHRVYIKNGRTMIPIRAISEALGYEVSYESKTRSVLIKTYEIIPIVMYHSISNNTPNGVVTTPKRFEEHLQAFKVAGYTPIDPMQLDAYFKNNGVLPKNPLLITFDDGYEDNYKYAYQSLKKYGFKATIFIIGHTILDNKNHSVNGSIPKLSWQQIEEMSDLITFQNHTYDSHFKSVDTGKTHLGVISTPIRVNGKMETEKQYYDRILKDFTLTENLLKERLGYTSTILSYPYGQYSDVTIKALKALNIPYAVTVKNGVARKTDNPYKLKRVTVDGNDTGKQLIEKLKKAEKE